MGNTRVIPGLPTPTVSPGRIGTGFAALLAAFVIAMLFMASYVGALHNPLRTPHGMPMAVGGPAQIAGRYAQALRSYGHGSVFTVAVKRTPQAARAAVLDHDAYAALVPASSGASELIVADASGPGVGDALAAQLSRAFAAQGQRLQVAHVAPLPPGDPRGISPFYSALSWVFAGYLGAIVLSTLAGAATRERRIALLRIGGLLGYAAVCALAGALIVGPGFGALSGHFLALWAMGVMICFSVAAITSGLQGMLGFIGTAVALLLFLVASNPSAGGAVAYPALPGLWRTIGPWLPTGAATSLVRNVFYFGAHHIAHSLWVLGGYAAIGALLTVLAGGRRYGPVEQELALGLGAAGAGAA